MPSLLKNLITKLQLCRTSKDAFGILDQAQGGSQGLTHQDGVYHLDDYSIFYIFGSKTSNAKASLEAVSSLDINSVPNLVEQIDLAQKGTMAVTKLENRAELVNYDEANKNGFVTAQAKANFLADLSKIFDAGVNLEILTESACTDLLYDKDQNRIVFANISHAQFKPEPDMSKKATILGEITSYI